MKSEQRAASKIESDSEHPNIASTRRKFVHRGMLGAPVLLVLKSAPVLAASCKEPSGFSVSGNFSQTNSNQCADPAPQPNSLRGDALASKKFAGNSSNGAELAIPPVLPGNKNASNYTLGDALAGVTSDPAVVAAAFINATKLQFSGVSATIVRSMWNDTANGTYTPTAGVTWHRDDVIKYLKYHMGMS